MGKEAAILVQEEQDENSVKVYLMDLQTNELELFYHGPEGYAGLFPVWSADGNSVLWAHGISCENDFVPFDIVCKSKSSSNAIDEFDFTLHRAETDPVWAGAFSPWGEKILYRKRNFSKSSDLYCKNLTTGIIEMLFPGVMFISSCDWAFVVHGMDE